MEQKKIELEKCRYMMKAKISSPKRRRRDLSQLRKKLLKLRSRSLMPPQDGLLILHSPLTMESQHFTLTEKEMLTQQMKTRSF
jgi:hypothetical protein